MTTAQRNTAEALAAMLPGASAHADAYTFADGDALYGDSSVLVHFTRPRRAPDIGEDGRRKVVRFDTLGSARIGRGGYVISAEVRSEMRS